MRFIQFGCIAKNTLVQQYPTVYSCVHFIVPKIRFFTGRICHPNEATQPQPLSDPILTLLVYPNLDSMINHNPTLLEKQYEREMAEVDLRLKKQKMLPKLKIKYNPLLATQNDYFTAQYSFNN